MLTPKRTAAVDGALPGTGMHVCPDCSSGLVQPIEWYEQRGYEQRGERWHVELRCPECEWASFGSFSQAEVDRFDRELDRGSQELLEDLRALTRANMREEIESFAVALSADRILPEDF